MKNVPCATFASSKTVFGIGVGIVDMTVVASQMTGSLFSRRFSRRSFSASLSSIAFTLADCILLNVDVEETRDFCDDEYDLREVKVESELTKEISSGIFDVEE